MLTEEIYVFQRNKRDLELRKKEKKIKTRFISSKFLLYFIEVCIFMLTKTHKIIMIFKLILLF